MNKTDLLAAMADSLGFVDEPIEITDHANGGKSVEVYSIHSKVIDAIPYGEIKKHAIYIEDVDTVDENAFIVGEKLRNAITMQTCNLSAEKSEALLLAEEEAKKYKKSDALNKLADDYKVISAPYDSPFNSSLSAHPNIKEYFVDVMVSQDGGVDDFPAVRKGTVRFLVVNEGTENEVAYHCNGVNYK